MTITMPRRIPWRAIPAVALAALLALTGCATPASAAPDTQAPDPSRAGLLPAAEGRVTYPLTVTTAVGEIVLEERPERIVMANSWDGDLFAALGVVPVATDEQITFYPWALDALPGEIATTWEVGDVQYPAEQIAGASPQLIVDTMEADPAAVEQIGAIAPVLGAPADSGADASWQERVRVLGEALDLSGRAQQVIDEYDAKFRQIRADHPEFAGRTVDYLVFWGGTYGTGFQNTAGSASEALLSDLGFDPNPNAGNSALEETLSDELLGTLTGDVLVISNQAGPEEFEEFFANPLIQGLGSVRSGQVVVLDPGDDFTVSHNGEPTAFTGHFGRAFSVGPLSKSAIADLITPLTSDVLK